MDLIQAPAITRLRRKSSTLDLRTKLTVCEAVESIRGYPLELPLVVSGRAVGMIASDWTREVWFSPFSGTNNMLTQLLLAQRKMSLWCKNAFQWGTPLGTRWLDYWCVGGNPVGGTYTGTALTLRQFDDTVSGGLPHGGNVSTKVKNILNGWIYSNAGIGTAYLYDRVADYPGTTMTGTTQTMVNTLAAQRYISAGEPGLMVMPTITAQINFTTGGGLASMTYVNQAGASKSYPGNAVDYGFENHGQTASNVIPAECAMMDVNVLGTIPFVPLAAGDSGARSITNYASDTADTAGGSVCWVLCKPLALICNNALNTYAQYDYVRQVVGMTVIKDGAHLTFMAYNHSTAANLIAGGFDFGWA